MKNLEYIMNDYTDEECRMFTELVLEMGEEWYRYMHGDRTEPDAPETLTAPGEPYRLERMWFVF